MDKKTNATLVDGAAKFFGEKPKEPWPTLQTGYFAVDQANHKIIKRRKKNES